jgi:hypothetical protein
MTERTQELAAYGAVLATNGRREGRSQYTVLSVDPAGVLWLICRGGGAPDLEEPVSPEAAAKIASKLRLTARGQEEFRRLGLLDVAQGGKVEIASFAGEWSVR